MDLTIVRLNELKELVNESLPVKVEDEGTEMFYEEDGSYSNTVNQHLPATVTRADHIFLCDYDNAE